MKTPQLLNYARDSVGRRRRPAGRPSLRDRRRHRRHHRLGRARFRRHARSRPQCRRPGAAQADLPPARADHQGPRPRHPRRARNSFTSSTTRPARPARTAGSTSRAAPAPCSPSRPRAAASCPTPMSCSTARSSRLSKGGSFVGQHIYTPLQGAAVHINAFNFPDLGDARKARPDPARRRARRSSSRPARPPILCEAAFRVMIDTGLLPAGRGPADRRRGRRSVRPFDRAGRGQLHRLGRDRARSSSPTRSCCAKASASSPSRTASTPRCSAPTPAPGTPEFDLFVKEVVNEMTVKAGQKCTAIRRAMAPAEHLDAVEAAIRDRLASRSRSATRATRTAAWARWSRPPSATTSAPRSPNCSAAGARIVSGNLEAEAGPEGGAFMAADPAPRRRSVGLARGPRCRGVRAGVDDHALPRPRRRHRARQSRHGQPGAVAVHSFAGRRARLHPGRRRLPRPDAGHQPRQCRRNRPATARRCRCWSTAAPAAPAEARKWAACAGSSITCSAPRSSRPRR